MKRSITLFMLLSSAFYTYAQVEPSVTLNEVSIQAAKVVSKPDGKTIYPTEVQKKTSNNGFSIIEKLSLVNLRVDNLNHTISAIDNRGSVQLRINGIVVGKQEMIALDPKRIAKIDFIDNPGIRYGEDIAYVINIFTHPNKSGYTIGTDLTSALTTQQGDGTLYGKQNRGKSEWAFSYGFSGRKAKGDTSRQRAEYTLNDGSIYVIERNVIESLQKGLTHSAKLTYNWADSTATIFQASLNGVFSKMAPNNYNVKDFTDGPQAYRAISKDDSKSCSPVLDLYFSRLLSPRQSITANAVGTYISTQTSRFFDERTVYQYDVNGKTASLLSEVIYENRLKPFTLSAGLNNSYKFTNNDYQGDAAARTKTRNNKLYAFGEIKGTLRQFRYSLGTGVSYIHYKQDTHLYDYWTFRPKASLTNHLGNGIQLNYTYQMWDAASRIAMTSDATIRTNSMEWTVGNPDLKPSHRMDHLLKLSYNTNRLQSSISGYYKQCLKPNMAHYERTEDNRFVFTQINQKEIDVLNVTAYVSYWFLPKKLQIAANGGMSRDFNYGNDYRHLYTSWFYSGRITAYLGNFSLQGYMDSGSRFLEGESKGFTGAYTTLQLSYSVKDWHFSMAWTNPFNSKHRSYENELLNRNLYKHTIGYSKDYSNLLTLNVSWRLSKGKKHLSADKRINLQDADNGIMK